MIIVVMGVSGVGKTTVGGRLAEELRWPFFEGDDFHPLANIARMERGEALTDRDRRPWLIAIGALIGRLDRADDSAVIACSALKEKYRRTLRAESEDGVRFVYLKADRDSIRERLARREGHFMDPTLLASQIETLEEPANALIVDATRSPEEIVLEIRRALGI